MSTVNPPNGLEQERKYLQERISQWEAVIADAQNTIDRLRAAMQALIGQDNSQERIPFERQNHNRYKKLSILRASVLILKEAGTPLDTSTIRKELEFGGWRTKARRPTATIYSTLHQHAESAVNRKIVRVGEGLWGLAEWRSEDDGVKEEDARAEKRGDQEIPVADS